MKILIHAHIYYPEMWEELRRNIIVIAQTAECELYITLVKACPEIAEAAKKLPCPAHIILVENRGYDVGPFIHVLNQADLKQFTYVVKLHTKRDITTSPWYINGYDLGGSKWRTYLLRFCATPENWQKSLQTLAAADCGMVADARLIMSNETRQKYYARISEWENILQTAHLKDKKYVAGTIFAAKAEVFYPLIGKLKMEDFSPTSRAELVCLAHDFEHILGNLVGLAGLKIKSFDGQRVPFWHKPLFMLRRFVWYRKTTPDKVICKLFGVQIYKRRKV